MQDTLDYCRQETLACPACEAPIAVTRVHTEPLFSRKATDFRELVTVNVAAFRVHVCSSCGFAAPDREWVEPDQVDSFAVARMRSEFADRPFPTTASEAWERAAHTADLLGWGPRWTSDLYLRAAWACVEEDDIEAERYYRLRAVKAFVEVVEHRHGIAPIEVATFIYLAAELYRRCGFEQLALDWYRKVFECGGEETPEPWVVAAARQQIANPQEFFS